MSSYLLNIYWMLLGLSVAVACISVYIAVSADSSRSQGRLVLLLTLVFLIVAGRWPTVLIPGPLNPDESLMLAQAIKFDVDLMPWRSIDPGTGGPVNSYLLLLMHWLGLPMGYPLARLAALVCICTHIVLMYLAMCRIGGVRSAAIAALPAAAFYAFGTDADFIHYSSELASLLTASVMLYLISRLPRENVRPVVLLPFVVGISAFAVCMSKIQGAPLAATLAIALLATVSPTIRAFLLRASFISLGGIFSVILLVGLLVWTGTLKDFHVSFVELPIQYASNPLNGSDLNELIKLRDDSNSYFRYWLFLTVLAAFLFPLHAEMRAHPWQALIRLCSILLIAFGAYLTLTRPGKFFPHYTAYLGLALPWISYYLLPWTPLRAATPDNTPTGNRK